MRLAELSARSGYPTASIKHFLRAGLLPPGVSESQTWASYDESHVRRLRLIRALTEVAGLSHAQTGRVLGLIDGAEDPHQVRGAAQWALSDEGAPRPSDAALARVDALLERHHWTLEPDSPHRAALARSIDTLAGVDLPLEDGMLDAYAEGVARFAPAEVASVPRDDPARAAEHVVVGTLLNEPVLLTLRRIAHESLSREG